MLKDHVTPVHKPDGKSQIVFITKADKQTNKFLCTCTHELYWSIYLPPSSEKHALLLANEYYQSNMAVNFCGNLYFIFHTNTELRFMFKSTNDKAIIGNIYEISSCKNGVNLFSGHLNSAWSCFTIDNLQTPTFVL